MKRKSIFFALALVIATVIYSQDLSVPKIWLKVTSDNTTRAILDVQSGVIQSEIIDTTRINFVNYNPSVLFGDSTIYSLVFGNLRKDSIVTIFTAYHTESEGLTGLWELDSDTNRQLWLNSHKASLQSTSVRYRKTTEKGGIVNTIRTEYPAKVFDTVFASDSTFSIDTSENISDTLFIGKSGEDYWSNGSFCEWLYFPHAIDNGEQQKWETYLAIKCGARLKNIYVNSNSDTLWNTNIDSLYSIGIGGIGRDDILTLNQPKTTILEDNLTVATQTPLQNLSHIIWGHNGLLDEPVESEFQYFIDTIQIHPFAKKWKLNTHGDNVLPQMNITYRFSAMLIPNTLRLVLNLEDSIIYNNNSTIYIPGSVTDTSITFDGVQFNNNSAYYLQIIAVGDSIFKPHTDKNTVIIDDSNAGSTETFVVSVTPNPSNTGEFTFELKQTEQTPMHINITDSHGKIVYSTAQNEPTNYYTLQYTIEQQGLYFINVKTPNHKKSVKLVIAQ